MIHLPFSPTYFVSEHTITALAARLAQRRSAQTILIDYRLCLSEKLGNLRHKVYSLTEKPVYSTDNSGNNDHSYENCKC